MFPQGSFRNPSSFNSGGDRNQPKQDNSKVLELKEEYSVQPAYKMSQLLSESDNRDMMKMVPIREGIPDEAATANAKRRNKNSLRQEIHGEVSDLVQKLSTLNVLKKASDDHKEGGDDPQSVSVITLAGENKGATMQFGGEPENDIVAIHRGYKLHQGVRAEQDLDTKSKGKAPSKEGSYVNSNVQGINNSILYNSSCPNRDPGVHMSLNNNPNVEREEEPVHPHGRSSRKGRRRASPRPAEIKRLPPPDPPVKRRCLRSLFMESSSDFSPERPGDGEPRQRRHGCRYECHKCKEKPANNQHGEDQKEQKEQSCDDKASDEEPKSQCSCFGRSFLSKKQG